MKKYLAIFVLGAALCVPAAYFAMAQAQAPAKAQGATAQPPAIPDTPAGRRMASWLPALNAGDEAKLRAWVAANFAKSALERMSAQERGTVHAEFLAETGGLRVARINLSEPLEVEIHAQAVRGGQWFRVALRVEPNEPHGVLGFMFDEAGAPSAASASTGSPQAAQPAGPQKSPSEIAREVEAFVNDLAARDEFSGAVLIAKDGQPILEKAWGKASIRYDVPNRVDTKFNLGSMNKMFTAVAIAQLVEQGKLSFDDKVGKHISGYPNAAVRDKVTVHHLLTHTSGLGSHFGSEKYERDWLKIRTVDDFLATVSDQSPQFEPGARFSYSNTGFIVLGKLIEKVSGMSYYDYVREKIFKPAGMNSSDCYEMDREEPNLATGYTRMSNVTNRPEPGPRRNNYFLHSVKGGPAGGGFSTVQDLLRFDRALRSGKLLSPQMTQTVLTGKVGMDRAPAYAKYAYGFGERTLAGIRVVGHNGGAPGISSDLAMFWENGWTVAVMCNYDRSAMQVSLRAEELILNLPPRQINRN